MSGRYRLAVVFILGDGNSTLTGNGENSVLKTPGSVVTGNLIALFGCCAAGRINGIKVYRICVRGIINDFGIFNYWLAIGDWSYCCKFFADGVAFSVYKKVMQCTGRKIVIICIFFVFRIHIFFPGNHETVVADLGDLYTHKAFSIVGKVGELACHRSLLGKIRCRRDSEVNIMWGILGYLVIFRLVDGGSNTQYMIRRNGHTVYTCITVKSPH